jgi:2-keto-4-pentenoate hydratase/2-oxohepta-3-ene-1,7-dioic acid hydratase in catechol pathway
MRLLNVAGRLCLERDGKAIDVETASYGRFSADMAAVYPRWAEFRGWADRLSNEIELRDYAQAELGPPVVWPRQIFAIGLNYRGHAPETGLDLPDTPMVFTKFASSITGPFCELTLPTKMVDWEAELVAVIGRQASDVPESLGWDYVAGLTVGQDLSERALQIKPPAPQQFSLAKSYAGFAPLGPVLVTADELANPDDLGIECSVNGEQVQKSRTGDLIFGVPALVSYLSSIVTLYPGDVIFTGTPSGVGFARTPQRYLRPGDELTTYAEGIGTMRQSCVVRPHV